MGRKKRKGSLPPLHRLSLKEKEVKGHYELTGTRTCSSTKIIVLISPFLIFFVSSPLFLCEVILLEQRITMKRPPGATALLIGQ